MTRRVEVGEIVRIGPHAVEVATPLLIEGDVSPADVYRLTAQQDMRCRCGRSLKTSVGIEVAHVPELNHRLMCTACYLEVLFAWRP